jgi:hypothetical protein
MPTVSDPHAGQPVLRSGASPKEARLVAIMLHGRGASAEDILGLAHQFSADDIAYVAPQAAGSTWYPYSFLAPIGQNEPWLGSALRVIAGLVETLARQGVPSEQLVASDADCVRSAAPLPPARRGRAP